MTGILLFSLLACAPDHVTSAVRSEAQPGTAALVSTSLRIAGTPDTVRVGVEFELRVLDEALDAIRRRRLTPLLTWESSAPQVATIVVDPKDNSRAKITFRQASAANITVRWGTRTGSWGSAAVASGGAPKDTSVSAPQPLASPAALPTASVPLPAAEGGGQVRRVRAGGNLQAAIDAASYGDVILLEPGARFVGPIRLRQKSGTGWITIRTDATPTTAGHRVSLGDTARFARIEAPATGNVGALSTDAAAAGYWIVNVDIARSADPTRLTSLVSLGDGGSAQNSLSLVPNRLVFDRVIIRGRPGLILRRCIGLNSAATAIMNSLVVECHEKGFDSQAIAGWNGPGPYLIRNNLLQGAGENVMFGGEDPKIPNLNPSDIVIEENHFHKPMEWFNSGQWTVKNLLELKQGRRVVVRGNLFENNWPDGQAGVAIVLKSVNQNGTAPWAETSDVTFVENVIRNSSAGITLAAKPEVSTAVPMSRLLIARNAIYRLGEDSDFPAATQRALLVLGGVARLHINENTMSSPSSVILIARDDNPPRVPDISFSRNVARYGQWGIMGGGFGLTSFQASYTSVVFSGNCIFASPQTNLAGYSSGAELTLSPESAVLPSLRSGLFDLADSACSKVRVGQTVGAPPTILKDVLQRAQSGRP